MDFQDDESAANQLEYLSDRLLRVFAHFFFVREFRHDKNFGRNPVENSRALILHVIGDACLDETLLALRDIDDFLLPRNDKQRQNRKARKDDLLASDFGFSENKSFLSNSEREAINKFVAHTTKQGPEVYQYSWDVWELASKCIAQCSAFLQWVENQYSLSHWLLSTAAHSCKANTQNIYAALYSERKSMT